MLIANNCCAADIYHSNHIQYNHPFMWCLLMYRDMYNLINQFDEINYRNIVVEESERIAGTYNVNIDHVVRAQFLHYFERPEYKTPTPMKDRFNEDRHLGYCHMRQYVIDKYNERVTRMCGRPAFLIHLNKNTWQCDIDETNVNELIACCDAHHYPVLVFGKAKLMTSRYVFHANMDFKYPYEIRDFVNQNLKDTLRFL